MLQFHWLSIGRLGFLHFRVWYLSFYDASSDSLLPDTKGDRTMGRQRMGQYSAMHGVVITTQVHYDNQAK